MGVALLGDGQGRDPPVASITPGSLGVFGDNPFSKSTSRAPNPGWQSLRITDSLTEPDMLSLTIHRIWQVT